MKASIRLILLIIAISTICSCGLLKKTTQKKHEKRTETVTKNIDSTSSKNSDSTSLKNVDSANLKKREEVKTSDVSIEFSDTSDHNKIEVTTDSNGKQVIKAEGKIKVVKVHKNEAKKLIDSSHLQKKDSASKSNNEQTSLKDKSKLNNSSNTAVVNKYKRDGRLPWYAYLILIVVSILLIYFLYKRYKYNIIAWFISLKNPGMKVYYDPKIKGYQVIDKKANKNTS